MKILQSESVSGYQKIIATEKNGRKRNFRSVLVLRVVLKTLEKFVFKQNEKLNGLKLLPSVGSENPERFSCKRKELTERNYAKCLVLKNPKISPQHRKEKIKEKYSVPRAVLKKSEFIDIVFHADMKRKFVK
jgi:hypothetical protein